MITFTRLFSLSSLALLVSGAVVTRRNTIVSPASQGVRYSVAHGNTREVHTTEIVSISNAALVVDQKKSVGVDEVPNQPPPETVPTAVHGRSTGRHAGRRTRTRGASVRNRPGAVEDYVQLFAGTGTSPSDRDSSIHGTASCTAPALMALVPRHQSAWTFCGHLSATATRQHHPARAGEIVENHR
ncbi:hypothetical protein FA15DRAFT_709878 [Coprinopsis marcescibilis]|uniref:Uncharacterized protein n=1 Tax=Coprinopsis marcescibilis TaxID=230819 RepID=A0A5C3KFG3_COPMA|nr:hypothetical protein FA15DRAFT_709878 [Coprinopsis marcescibilis]